jgi:hypothetical protein
MATLLKLLNNLADIKSAGGGAVRVRTQVRLLRWLKLMSIGAGSSGKSMTLKGLT